MNGGGGFCVGGEWGLMGVVVRQHPQVGGGHRLPGFLEADSQRAADDDKVVPEDVSRSD